MEIYNYFLDKDPSKFYLIQGLPIYIELTFASLHFSY